MASDKLIEMRQQRGLLWVMMPAAMTMDNYRHIEESVSARIEDGNDRVVLDMTDTEHIYSSGIGLLIRLRRVIAEKDGLLCLVNVSQKLRGIFENMHLEKVFPIYATDVEFELSHEEIWRDKLAEEKFDFVFISQKEQSNFRLTFSGHMDGLHDLTAISTFVPDPSVSKYVFNLENLEVLDTYGAEVFLQLIEKIRSVNGQGVVYGANDIIRELFSVLSIDKMIRFVDSEQQAL
ncbi:MAG: STAS domain-containing protein [Chitinivibrionales bacterium]